MAMTILPQQRGDWAEALSGLGKGLGGGTASALEGLAQRKLREVQGRAKSNKLMKAIPGITPEVADLIQDFEGNPETQRHLIQLAASGLLGGQPKEYAQQAEQLIGPEQHIPEQHQVQQQQEQIPQDLSELLNSAFPLRQLQQQNGLGALLGNQQQEPAIQKQQQLQAQQLAQAQQQVKPSPPQITPDERQKRIAEAFLSPQERAAAKKADSAERIKKWEYNKDLIQKSDAEYRNAKVRLEDLNRFEELETEGEGLDTPGYVEFLKRSGLDIPALMNAESEEFQKIAANFLSGAKEAFGGRVSNYEVEQFLKTIPSLSQSPEGRKRVIANLKRMYRGQVFYGDAKNKIIKENGGEPPFDLGGKINERLDESMAKNAEAFRKDLARPVPKGQNKFITALGAVAGNVAGSAGKLAKGAAGAALGANIGKVAGPWGAVGGGVLGGLGGLSGLI